jgi:predicted DNA binding CopG/RHH family protein
MPRLPVFETEEEFAQFVETHDMGEYWDEFEDVKDVEITIPKPADEFVSVRLYPDLVERIKKIATEKGVPYQTLIQQWLTERLRQEETAA